MCWIELCWSSAVLVMRLTFYLRVPVFTRSERSSLLALDKQRSEYFSSDLLFPNTNVYRLLASIINFPFFNYPFFFLFLPNFDWVILGKQVNWFWFVWLRSRRNFFSYCSADLVSWLICLCQLFFLRYGDCLFAPIIDSSSPQIH